MRARQLNKYEVQHYRKCEEQAAEGIYRPLINTVASCCERSFDTMIDHLGTVEVKKKKEEDRIRPETMVARAPHSNTWSYNENCYTKISEVY